MFSLTVMGAKSWRPSGTSEQPRKTILSGGNFPISFVSKRISPDRGGISPDTVLRRVVFPAPFAPMIVTISPAPMCIVTFLSTLSRPYPDSTFLILSIRPSIPKPAPPPLSPSRVVPQVHPDHLPVLLDREGTILGDLFPVTHHDDLVRDLHDEGHVVLHEQHGDAQVADPRDQPPHFVRFPHVQPGRGFVEQEELRLAGERPADLDDALLAVGQADRFRSGMGADAEQLHDLEALLPDSPLLLPRERQVQHPGVEPRPAVDVTADHDVLEDRHLREEPDVLERPHHAADSDLEGRHAVDLRPPENDLAGIGRKEPGDQVEDRRLPGAVRPDQRLDRSRGDFDGEVVDGLEAAEPLADPPDRKKRHGASSSTESRETARFRSERRWRRSSPSGANSMISMRMTPKTVSS